MQNPSGGEGFKVKWVGKMYNFLSKRFFVWILFLFLIVPTSGIFAQDGGGRKYPTITLSPNAQIKILSTGKTVFKGGHPTLKGPHITAKIQLLQNEKSKITSAQAADKFFSVFAVNLIRLQEKKAVVYVVTKREKASASNGAYKEAVELFSYDRIEPDLWMPKDRTLPEWLKRQKEKKVHLSNGEYVLVEKQSSQYDQLLKKLMPSIDLRTEQKALGKKSAWRLIRRYSEMHLSALRKENKHILISMFTVPVKEGIHARPRLTTIVLKKNDKEFWLLTSRHIMLFKDNVPGLVLAYQPTTPHGTSEADNLKYRKEAKEFLELYGNRVADNLGVKFVIIQAQWSTDKFGVQVPMYRTVFEKGKDGIWKMLSAPK